MQAIVTRYHGATNTRPSKIGATAAAGRMFMPYNHGLTLEQNHKMAAALFVQKYEWRGVWAMGCLPNGDWAHVNTEA